MIYFLGEVVSARSTDRLVFTGNKIIYADLLKGRNDIVAIDLRDCTKVLIKKTILICL